jgi:hypothetical protein
VLDYTWYCNHTYIFVDTHTSAAIFVVYYDRVVFISSINIALYVVVVEVIIEATVVEEVIEATVHQIKQIT